MCAHICMPTHPTVPRFGGRCLCICVHAHCSGWDASGGLCLLDLVPASLRFGVPSCSLSPSRGIKVLQRPSPYSYSSRSCCQGWRRWQLGPSYSLLAEVAAAYPRNWVRWRGRHWALRSLHRVRALCHLAPWTIVPLLSIPTGSQRPK